MTLTAEPRRFPAPPAVRPRAGSSDGGASTPAARHRAYPQAPAAGSRRTRRRRSRSGTSSRGRSAQPLRRRRPRVARRLRGTGLGLWVRRLRIPLALLCGLSAVAAGLLAGVESQGETVTAVRVTQDVPAGEELAVGMLEEVSVDAEAVPGGEPATAEEVAGRQAAVPLPSGAVVLTSLLVGPGLLAGQPEGDVAVPVRPADTALVGMLTPGQEVDVILSAESLEEGTSSRTVARAAPVLWTPSGEGDDWFPQPGDGGQVVVIGVSPSTAQDIAQAAHEGHLHLSLVG
nr:RcpC/CpaB family pilus assembly protein [Nesterenkonia xinjiangensis]